MTDEERLNSERLGYFLTEVARGTVDEFLDVHRSDLRRGILAAIVVNQLVDFIHKGRLDLRSHREEGKKEFRGRLARDCCGDLLLLQQVADATKHPVLWKPKQDDPPREISGIENVRSEHPALLTEDGGFLLAEDSGRILLEQPDVLVDTQGGQRLLADVVKVCMDKLVEMIAAPPPSP
jgi:hypothetical protein